MKKTFLPLLPLTLAALAGCPQPPAEPQPSDDPVDCSEGFCVLSGTILEDLTLTADTDWLLRGGVFVGDDTDETILTIEPGTTIYGETSTLGMLAITRGSKIMAEGTEDAPIVFTSSQEVGSRARGDWGGLIINGRAPVNGCDEAPCESFGEGGTGFFGGDDEADSSGVLKYVRIEFAGSLISPDNELNGVAFQGVGSGTEVDYLQVHMAKDDGIEFFGGTVGVKHVLTTGIADDNLDWTDGWQGQVQFFVAQQYEDAGDNGIEADNNAEDNNAAPRSNPILSNLTLIGSPQSDLSDVGMLLREGTGAHIANTIVTGWGEGCLDIDHDATFENAVDENGDLNGELVVENSVFFCDNPYLEDDGELFTAEAFFLDMNGGNVEQDPELAEPFDPESFDFRPQAVGMDFALIPDHPFFDAVSFQGAVGPDVDWTRGWTTQLRN